MFCQNEEPFDILLYNMISYIIQYIIYVSYCILKSDVYVCPSWEKAGQAQSQLSIMFSRARRIDCVCCHVTLADSLATDKKTFEGHRRLSNGVIHVWGGSRLYGGV